MKKIIYAILLCIPLVSFCQENKTSNETDVNITWDGRHCRGTNGLCNISNTEDNKVLSNATIIDHKDGTITFNIDRNKLSNEEQLKIVGRELTPLLESNDFIYALDYDFEFAMWDKTNVISKGNYPLIITKDTITITLNLK